MYFPGGSFGTFTWSYTASLPLYPGKLGAGKESAGEGGFAQREQSLPSVSGQGSQAPEEQLPGVRHPSTSSPAPASQAPRAAHEQR